MAANESLNNQWLEILRAGTPDGETYTGDDLDKMVNEYGSRQDADKAPVGLGTQAEGKSDVVGKIHAIRRAGNSLEGKFSNVDPRAERLYSRGAFPKTSVQVKRAPEGDSLQRVGLISPTYDGNSWRDDKTPSLDELWGKHTGSKEHVFAEAPLAGQWLELFRTGEYGNKGSFSNSDLDQIVSNFDPSFHEPPAVIGHPEHDAPAYAWVDGLKRNGNTLLGKLKQVQPQFEEMVKSGRFKKRSISLYQTGKGFMLRHVGFLGAQPPEVKGLANAVFKEDRIRFVTVTFGESGLTAPAAISRLKQNGYWLPLMDQCNFAETFKVLEGTPGLLERNVECIEGVLDALNIDPNGARFSQRAKQYSRFHGVSFGEAMDRVQEQRATDAAGGTYSATNSSGARLTERARYIQRSRGVTFGEALDRAIEEDPELLRS